VFSKAASDGADANHDLSNAGRYTTILRPRPKISRTVSATEEPGFCNNAEVRVTMRMTLLDSTEKTSRKTTIRVVSGSSYMISGKPVERVNKSLMRSCNLMRRRPRCPRVSASHTMVSEAH